MGNTCIKAHRVGAEEDFDTASSSHQEEHSSEDDESNVSAARRAGMMDAVQCGPSYSPSLATMPCFDSLILPPTEEQHQLLEQLPTSTPILHTVEMSEEHGLNFPESQPHLSSEALELLQLTYSFSYVREGEEKPVGQVNNSSEDAHTRRVRLWVTKSVTECEKFMVIC